MSLLKICLYPDPILRVPTEVVTDFGAKMQLFFDHMIETMYVEDGVGLSAPQVGIAKKIMIVSPRARRGEEIVFVNPEIYAPEGSQIGPEGCLSFPGVTAHVVRATKIRLRYHDRFGNQHDEEFYDFPARVIQHENDHLDGRLLIDQVSFDERQKLLARYNEF